MHKDWPKIQSKRILEHVNKETLFSDSFLNLYLEQRADFLKEEEEYFKHIKLLIQLGQMIASIL